MKKQKKSKKSRKRLEELGAFFEFFDLNLKAEKLEELNTKQEKKIEELENRANELRKEKRSYEVLASEKQDKIGDLGGRLRTLENENKDLKTVMIAAAEEIKAHWGAHCCDPEGFGPRGLLTRLERGIPEGYGYTAGAFAKAQKHIEELEKKIRTIGAIQDPGPIARLLEAFASNKEYLEGWKANIAQAMSLRIEMEGTFFDDNYIISKDKLPQVCNDAAENFLLGLMADN